MPTNLEQRLVAMETGQQSNEAYAVFAASAADATATNVLLDFSPQLRNIHSMLCEHRDSTGQLKASKALIQNNNQVLISNGTGTIAAGDLFTVRVRGAFA